MTAKAPPLIPLGRPAAAAAPATEAAASGAARVYLETYGCQMNVADSDLLVGLLAGRGYRRVDRPDQADVILLNTCAVREKAEERVLARAAELAGHKQRRPGVVLGIAGCMAEHLKGSLVERAPFVDLIAGPDSYRRLPDLVAEARGGAGAPLLDVQLDRFETYEGLSGADGGDGVSGFVTIQRGCDKCCTFCVVPLVRGRERSIPPREVLRQARALAAAGYREVVLLGQTVNSYRHDDADFADLLRAVATIDGLERIRFTSPYPVDFTPRLIEVLAGEPKVAPHVHVPVQSGSDAVLERMRRGYTSADVRALLAALRAAVPDLAVSTDLLSGFCGETEADHQATLDLMRELRFDSAFMFSYSERSGTYAARRIDDDVAPEVKRRRLAEIIALQETISAEVNAAQVGKRERVLIHGRSKRRADQVLARTGGFKAVILPGECGRPGDFVDVRIERSTMATLFGAPIAPRDVNR